MSLVSTVGGVITETSRRLNEVNVSSDNVDRYLDWINMAQEDLAGFFPRAPWLETSAVLTLAANTRRWQISSIASDVRQIYDITISAQNIRLTYVPREQFDTMDPQPNDTGVPSIYTLYNDEIEFYPTSNITDGAQVRYGKTTASVSATSATFEIPRRYIEAVIQYSTIRGLQDREDWDQAQIVEAQYQRMIGRIKKELKRTVFESRRFLSNRELTTVNRFYNDEINQMFFG